TAGRSDAAGCRQRSPGGGGVQEVPELRAGTRGLHSFCSRSGTKILGKRVGESTDELRRPRSYPGVSCVFRVVPSPCNLSTENTRREDRPGYGGMGIL